ncbi:MAG: 2-amino-4-hydroxy-6-hydroxymethyldihydropteridine diphosphokinase [Lentisphaeria bacterium]|nr:2-amino-4-hydroxy-6-hydroxymethyldihydropteridine diphosphokinase [Lentisphaeria bacterium]NQZ68952.1 2-amino-4-hydroxy-6-hydroxymethyldihydropteridine diphosphokinase [Lentisphaeria bacterium]
MNSASKSVKIAIGLGSNLGDRKAYITEAVQRLSEKGLHELKLSRLYETEAFDCEPDAPAFYNAVAVGKSTLTAEELLAACLETECEMGRLANRGYHENRIIDIDLLLVDEQVKNDASLSLPHAQLTERDFVLQPLAELVPDWQIPPHNKTVKDLLSSLPDQNGKPI